MDNPTLKLSKADARRALIAHHFRHRKIADAFSHLRSIQFDPLAPIGTNHDLVLQARVKGYRIGDWQRLAYKKREIYDGWDKQACLVPFSGWPARRVMHRWHQAHFRRIFDEHAHAIDAVLSELKDRGPLLPKEFEFQERKPEWKDTWFGPSLTKQTLRALWHTGKVMTSGRRGSHHVYDLTERVVPPAIYQTPPMSEPDSIRSILHDRHAGMGLVRPTAPFEVWSMHEKICGWRGVFREMRESGELAQVDIDGMTAYATHDFIASLDERMPPKRVIFVAPLDHLMWDRRTINHLFGFDYIWEVYKPESERLWGYYVLPVLYGDRFVGRAEFWCRKQELEIRAWHWEGKPPAGFWPAFEKAMHRLKEYCGAETVRCAEGVDQRIKEAV